MLLRCGEAAPASEGVRRGGVEVGAHGVGELLRRRLMLGEGGGEGAARLGGGGEWAGHGAAGVRVDGENAAWMLEQTGCHKNVAIAY